MKFEWDEEKNRKNELKHGLSFELATEIFEGRVLISEDKRSNYNERRFNSLGKIENSIIINVTHTDRNGITRIISARLANKKERKAYAKNKRRADR